MVLLQSKQNITYCHSNSIHFHLDLKTAFYVPVLIKQQKTCFTIGDVHIYLLYIALAIL